MKISRRNLKTAINEALGSGAMSRLKIAIDKEYKKGKQQKAGKAGITEGMKGMMEGMKCMTEEMK